MSYKSTLVICDTCVIIEAFRTNSWSALISKYQIVVSQVIIEETLGYKDDKGDWHKIDLTTYTANGTVKIIDPSASDLKKFLSKYDRSYAERLDAGELSILCYLFGEEFEQEIYICSADAIVFKILGKNCRSDMGVSLEELLDNIGYRKPLREQFKKSFRETHSRAGFSDSFQVHIMEKN